MPYEPTTNRSISCSPLERKALSTGALVDNWTAPLRTIVREGQFTGAKVTKAQKWSNAVAAAFEKLIT